MAVAAAFFDVHFVLVFERVSRRHRESLAFFARYDGVFEFAVGEHGHVDVLDDAHL